MSAPLRVLLADDHAPTRAAVGEALCEQGIVVVASVACGPAALEAAREHQPDVALLDIHMPGNGIVATADITRQVPGVTVVILTASGDDEDLFAALRAGAAGYLLKDMDPDRLAPALQAVLAGEAVLPRWLVSKVVDAFRTQPRRRFALPNRPKPVELTEREAEVLELMARGLSTEEIAARMFVASVTVRTHIRAILRKLRVTDRQAAIRMALGDRG
ncbi:response regulator [Petropleomorpha daqingensis]|uniref:DNA-binding NarL/FixJ family response regulator n=1 Tax=Petropleomorpha daqingensis TaxID=2026353 RepID=A0A853CKJ0_9ACTN|nr:response regulator transcription factor [Petropleomorpha daqingensis]NYJ06493.1 DNA-binding NarL/FixJ family response regulator [Petropleomorpha daqingensis]